MAHAIGRALVEDAEADTGDDHRDRVLRYGIIAMLCAFVLIGLWASLRVKGDSTNFLVAGRTLPLHLAAATFMAQSVDSNATLGNTDLASAFGFWAGAALPLGLAMCLLLTGLFYAKPLNRMGLTTLPDFYRVKYGRITEIVASLIMLLSFSFLLAGNMVAGGRLFEVFMDLSYTAGTFTIAAIVLVYTGLGGLFAVAYTDMAQVLVALVGSMALLGYYDSKFGVEPYPAGMGPGAWEQLSRRDAGALVNWASLLALGLGDIVAIDFMARVFAAKTPEAARWGCIIGCVGTILIGVPYSLMALTMPDVLAENDVEVGDQPVLYALIKEVVPAGIGLLVLAAIVSASLSTADGAILGTSSVVARNVIGIRDQHMVVRGQEVDVLLWVTRATAVLMTLLGVLLAIRVEQTGIMLLLAFDLGFAGLLVPLTGGLYWKRSTWQGALACIVLASLARIILFIVSPTMFGVENDLAYIGNNTIDADFDGIPTLICPIFGLILFVVVSLLTYNGEDTTAKGAEGRDEAAGKAQQADSGKQFKSDSFQGDVAVQVTSY